MWVGARGGGAGLLAEEETERMGKQ
jgi:hypothetical protein